MGFNEIKKKLIKCLIDGYYEHETRKDIDIKNVFMRGDLSVLELIEIKNVLQEIIIKLVNII